MDSKMKFCIGTNFNPGIIEAIKKYDSENCITTLYGKINRDIVGGGRPSFMLPDISWKALADYIDVCHKNKLEFNYLLNAMCTGNIEYEKATHRKLLRYVGELADIGVDWITTNSIYLCELVKTLYPKLKVSIGQYAKISILEEVRRWINHGADELTLHTFVNRDFSLLEKMLNHTKKSGVNLRLIANNICIRSCHLMLNHGNMIAHSSQKGKKKDKTIIDYCLYQCSVQKIKNPMNLIASEWIRPEDVSYYDKLRAKTGNKNLSIKLVERTKNMEFLERVIKAYMSRRYDGNLLDILNWPDQSTAVKLHKAAIARRSLLDRYNIGKVLGYYEMFYLPKMTIDNNMLDHFLDKFLIDFPCATSLCDLGDSPESGVTCSYCKMWAEKALSFSEDSVREWLLKADDVTKNLNNGSIFGK